jgi:regulation of enolase protein 1 (concanavalin A-like superfamily)
LSDLLLAVILATVWLNPSAVQAQAGGILRERFGGLGRDDNSLAQLTNDVRFLNGTPTLSNILASFSTELNVADDYGQRLRAFITAPSTGNYTFWIASDEVSQLFLSTNENPLNKRLIAYVDPRVQPANYTTFTWQQSSDIALQGGQRYYIEALHKEANLIDHLSVQWRLPNNATESPIPGSRLVYEMAPLITLPPANVTVEEGRPAVFTADVANVLPQTFRWQRNGADVQVGTNRSYTLASAALSDHGALFAAVITNLFGATNTTTATLTVFRDTNAPTVVKVFSATPTNVFVIFSEPVEAASALNPLNYLLAGVPPLHPVFGDDARTVILTSPTLVFPSEYSLSINAVRDRAGQPNTLAATQVVFTATAFNPQSLGNPAPAGSVTPVPGGADVSGGGADIGGTSDQFQIGFQVVSGNFDFRARVQSLDFRDVWTKAGLMARESLAANSRFAAALATPTVAGCFFESRSATGGFAVSSGSFAAGANIWLRLQRAGDLFTGFASSDGGNWHPLGSVSIAMSNRVYLGFAVASHDTNQIATAQFRDFGSVSGGTVAALLPEREPLGPSSRKTGLVISEIMYHPRDVYLGTNKAELEFIELFNSNPFYEDVSGFRFSGDIEYTFPPGTILAGGSFLVVARVPSDVQAAYGISGVRGPFTNNLPNDAGRVRLRNDSGTVLLEVNYSSKFPWPVAADGAGHSLVLARPSYGEGQRAAWAASDAINGSPGRLDPNSADPLRAVVINEFLAHTDEPLLDFIELYNHSNQPVDVGGAYLSDSAATNKFQIPSPTILPARGFVTLDQAQLGFALSSAGERIFFVNPAQTRVIDAVGFEPQANGVSSGRFPDGAPTFHELASRTGGAANAPLLIRDVVINEILYNPISGDGDDEFVELFNKGVGAINVSGWRFSDGIDFIIPSNTVISAGGYLVVAKNRTNLLAHYPNLASVRLSSLAILTATCAIAASGWPWPGPNWPSTRTTR